MKAKTQRTKKIEGDKTVAKNEETKKPGTVELPIRLVDGIAQYLITRPFAEVAGLMRDLQVSISAQQQPKPLDKKGRV